jgi:hypothetical protein
MGGNTKKTVRAVINLVDRFKADPYAGGEALIRSYALTLDTQKPEPEPKKPSPTFHETEWRAAEHRRHNDKLDSILSDAIDNATKNREEWETTAEERKALKERLPHLSFDEAMSQVLALDTALRTDPVGATHRLRLAQVFGLPATAAQRQEHAAFSSFYRQTEGMVDRVANQLGADDARMGRMTEIVQDPKFVRSNNMQNDMVRAYQVTVAQDQQAQRDADMVGRMAQNMPLELYAEVEKVVHGRDAKWMAIAKSDPYDPTTVSQNFGAAVAVAQERLSLAQAVSKANKNKRIKSSPSPSSSGDSKTLDAIISAALKPRFG